MNYFLKKVATVLFTVSAFVLPSFAFADIAPQCTTRAGVDDVVARVSVITSAMPSIQTLINGYAVGSSARVSLQAQYDELGASATGILTQCLATLTATLSSGTGGGDGATVDPNARLIMSQSPTITNVAIKGPRGDNFVNGGEFATISWNAQNVTRYVLRLSCPSGITIKSLSDGGTICSGNTSEFVLGNSSNQLQVRILNTRSDLSNASFVLDASNMDSGHHWRTISTTVGFYVAPTLAETANQPFVLISNPSSPVAQTTTAGAQNFVFANYKLDAVQSGEDIKFTTFKGSLTGSATAVANNLSSCKLYDGSTALTTGSNEVNPSTTDVITSAKTYTFTFDNGNLVVTKGTVKTLTLKCNISASTASGVSYSWGLPVSTGQSTGISAISLQTVTPSSSSASAGQAMTISTSGRFTVTVDGSSPSYSIAAGGTSGNLLAVFKLHATGEAINLQKFSMQLSDTDHSSASDLTSSGSNGAQITLWDSAGNKVGSATFTGSNTKTTSTLSVDFIIPKDADKLLIVKGDLSAIGPSSAVTMSGDFIAMDYDGNDSTGTQGRGVSSGTLINQSSPLDTTIRAIGGGVRVMRSFPIITMLPAPGGLSSGKILRFKVTASPQGSISLYKFGVRISTIGTAVVTGVNAYAYDGTNFTGASSGVGNNGQLLASNLSTLATGNTAGTANAIFYAQNSAGTPSPLVIPAGSSKYIEVTGSIAYSSTGNTVDTFLQGDSASPSPYFIGTYAMVGGSDFVWSPNSKGNPSTLVDSDWTNGYGVYGLSATENISCHLVDGVGCGGSSGGGGPSASTAIRQVVTGNASDITATSAKLSGAVEISEPVMVGFKYGTDQGALKLFTSNTRVMTSTGDFSLPISGLIPGATYYYQLVAKTDNYVVGQSGSQMMGLERQFTALTASSATAPNLGTAVTGQTVTLSWSVPTVAPSSASSAVPAWYQVMRSTSSTIGSFSNCSSSSNYSNREIDKPCAIRYNSSPATEAIPASGTYYYYVRAIYYDKNPYNGNDGWTNGPTSTGISATVASTPASTQATAVPSSSILKSTTQNSITMDWPRPDSISATYDVRRTTNPDATFNQTTANSVSFGSDFSGHVNDTGLTADTNYYYYIVSVPGFGLGTNSAPVKVTVKTNPAVATPTVTSAPRNLRTTATTPKISLAWDSSASGTALSYFIVRKLGTSASSQYLLGSANCNSNSVDPCYVPETTTGGTSAIDTNSVAGSTYTYVVLSSNNVGLSAPSNPITSAIPVANKPAPNDDNTAGSTAGNCSGLISWWWNETTGGNFANGDRRILCYNGRFYSPGSSWGGQAYSVDACVQKGSFYSKEGTWVTGSKTTDSACSTTSLNSSQKRQMASILSSMEAILKAMRAGLGR